RLGLLRRTAREVQEVEPRTRVAPDHLVSDALDLRRARRLPEDRRDVRPDRRAVLRAQAEVGPADGSREGVGDRPRDVPGEEEGAGKPDVRGRGGDGPDEPIAARHFFLHGEKLSGEMKGDPYDARLSICSSARSDAWSERPFASSPTSRETA